MICSVIPIFEIQNMQIFKFRNAENADSFYNNYGNNFNSSYIVLSSMLGKDENSKQFLN